MNICLRPQAHFVYPDLHAAYLILRYFQGKTVQPYSSLNNVHQQRVNESISDGKNKIDERVDIHAIKMKFPNQYQLKFINGITTIVFFQFMEDGI